MTIARTMAIATLLVVTFSCNKQDSDSSALNITKRANAVASSHTLRDNDELLGFGSPVGDWVIYYDWVSVGEYDSSFMTVRADGTFIADGISSGTWIEGKGIFTFMFNAPFRTTYSGTERISRIVGIMSTFDIPNPSHHAGNFYMLRAKSGSFKAKHKHGMPNLMGKNDLK